ncbi:MAG: alpha/beta hydrolase [Bacteroidetes bacterium]|nr:alpha/beta hydrolase [Bacteroidota bacterium]
MIEKIFLLPGFGENHRCYRNLVPLLRSDFELIHVDYRTILHRTSLFETSAYNTAKELIREYKIGPQDRMVGHSMGGYFSYVASTIQGNPVAMLGSFSDTDKIVRMTKNKLINYTATGFGFIKTPLMKAYLKKRVRNKQFLGEMLSVQDNFQSFSNEDMIKMLKISYGELLPPALEEPLRIHALDDKVVRTPDQDFREVSGGHFGLIFHPEEVYSNLEGWLNR